MYEELARENVRVHRQSPAPARIGAEAYTKGDDIYLAPGNEKHLSHELGHVAQQRQNRVRPTGKIGGKDVNESPALEHEADSLGSRIESGSLALPQTPAPQNAPIQGRLKKKDRDAQIGRFKNRSIENRAKSGKLMADQLKKEDLSDAHELIELGNEHFLVPTMINATKDWESKDESKNILDALMSVFRENSEFSVMNTMLLKKVYGGEIKGVRDTLDTYQAEGKQNGDVKDSAYLESLLLPILQDFSDSAGGNAEALKAFGGMDSALSQVPMFAENQAARNRSNLNNIILRGINPGIITRMGDAVGKDKRGLTNSMTPAQQQSQRLDLSISHLLQKSVNTYTQFGNQGTAEAPNALHDMFDQIIGQLSGGGGADAAAPEAAAPERERGMAHGPLTPKQQALLDKWSDFSWAHKGTIEDPATEAPPERAELSNVVHGGHRTDLIRKYMLASASGRGYGDANNFIESFVEGLNASQGKTTPGPKKKKKWWQKKRNKLNDSFNFDELNFDEIAAEMADKDEVELKRPSILSDSEEEYPGNWEQIADAKSTPQKKKWWQKLLRR